jgi:hypothetical protein
MLWGSAGFAAAARDTAKQLGRRCVSSALSFVPLLVESFGRLGAPCRRCSWHLTLEINLNGTHLICMPGCQF